MIELDHPRSLVIEGQLRWEVYEENLKAFYVVTPNGQKAYAGEYKMLSGEIVNSCPIWEHHSGECWLYSKDRNNRSPPLIFRTYQILPHTNSYYHCLYSYLDLLPQGPLGYPRWAKPPWYPRSH